MKYFNFILCAILLSTTTVSAQFATVWAQGSGSVETDYMGESVVDKDGNTYFIGSITSSYTFENDVTVQSKGGYDMMIAKIDAEGNLAWAKSFGSESDEMGRSIALDNEGNIFFSGSFSSVVDFGNDVMATSAGGMDAFVAKMNAMGEIEWVLSGGGSDNEEWTNIETDAEGNSYVAGYIESGDGFLSGRPLLNFGGRDMFIAKIDADGKLEWVKTPGATDDENINDIALSSNGDLLVNASFASELIIGNDTIDAALGLGLNIKYDADGEVLWTDQTEKGNTEFEGAVDFDADGNIYTSGMFEGEITFGSEKMVSKGGNDIFIVKQDAEGKVIWATQAGGTDDEATTDIEVLADGSVIIGGYFESTSTFGKNTIASAGEKDNFVAKLNADGSFYGVVSAGGTGDDMVHSISSTTSGEIIATGTFEGTSKFKTEGNSKGESDHYVWKIEDQGVFVQSKIEKTQWSVFPNPVQGAITVNDLSVGSNMILRDITGHQISDYRITAPNVTINAAPLNPGVYFLEVIDPSGTMEVQRFIKK